MFDENKNLSKFEKEFLTEFLNDIEKRENSTWVKSWDFVESQNAFSGHKYSGMNALFLELLSRGRKLEDPRYATFNQAKQNGYHIKKGSKGIPIQFFTFINKETRKNWNEKEFQEKTKNMTAEEKNKELKKKVAIAKTFHVFNAKDLISNENNLSLSENKPLPKFIKKINTNKMIDDFEENLIKNMELGFSERHSEGAYYTPSLDEVTMPLRDQFNSYEERMATFLHEVGHATGHEKRLNRDLDTTFGSTKYSKEEMKVELNSVFMSNTLGLNLSENQKENHLLYLDSWGKNLKNDPKEFLYVLQDSLKIKDYMIEKGNFADIFLEKELELGKDISEEQFENLSIAFKSFSDREYENQSSLEEIKEEMKAENFIFPIAYTEVDDLTYTMIFEKQVSYNLKEQLQETSLSNEFISLTNKQLSSVEDYIEDLNIAGFDDFISDENMGIDREEISNLVKLSAYTEDFSFISVYADKNDFEIDYINQEEILKNKNSLLKNINSDTIEFFESFGVNISDNYIDDIDYKHLIDIQLYSYQSVEELSQNNKTNIIYRNDIDNNDDFEIYTSYKDLWENNFKNDFIEIFEDNTLDEINEVFNSKPKLLDKLYSQNPEVKKEFLKAKEYEKSIEEKDLDNDGIPDRIDIDDNRNEVQNVSDLSLVGNRTSKSSEKDKEIKEDKENKIEERQRENISISRR